MTKVGHSESTPYARRLRLSLEESRDEGLDFDSAWTLALARAPVPRGEDTWLPETLRFARDHFEAAYRGYPARVASILGEAA